MDTPPEENDYIRFAMRNWTGEVIKVNEDGTFLVQPYSEPIRVLPSQIIKRKPEERDV